MVPYLYQLSGCLSMTCISLLHQTDTSFGTLGCLFSDFVKKNEQNLFGVEVDKAVSSWLALQRTRLMEQEVKLLHFAKLLQELH